MNAVEIQDLNINYKDLNVLKDINITIKDKEFTAIVGPNGGGKTTLLKTILQEIPPLAGTAKIGNRVQIGYFSQSYERLNPNQTIMDNFLTEYGFTDEQTRSLLGSMLFRGEDVFKEIGTLSGGQKARLVLLKLVLDGANCLLLDEPTNHLDIAAKEAVEAALETFAGTVLLVSHDRYLVNEVAGRIWAIERGKLIDYKGNYDFYLEQRTKNAPVDSPEEVGKKARGSEAEASEKVESAKNHRTKEHKYSKEEAEKLLPKVELSIREQEAMRKVLEKKIADPANQQDLATSTKMAEEYAQYGKTIDELMTKWEEIMECLE